MKKIIISLLAVCGLFAVTSCQDMLESESSRQLFDPKLDSKTDSVFYTFGIMQAMQQVADQYVLQGEMRGDNVATTTYTDNNLRKLANFSADLTNKYDSAYQYYRVINNCNYYITHRDTTLLTGATEVVMKEYVAIKAFRAWAYLQLARNYGKVPFITEPLTSISQIEKGNYPEYTLSEIVSALAPDLEQYAGYDVPSYSFGRTGQYTIGSTNTGTSKSVYMYHCLIPVDVILGELYLEDGQYEKAASHYTTYLTQVCAYGNNLQAPSSMGFGMMRPSDFSSFASANNQWNANFNSGSNDLLTYVPMAVNSQKGTTTSLPDLFGYKYYSTDRNDRYDTKVQLMPSDAYILLNDSAYTYYFAETTGQTVKNSVVNSWQCGDLRKSATLTERESGDSTISYMTKYNNGNIFLFRNTTVWLHLAEAFNRMNHPDLAFAILKDGIQEQLLDSTAYLTDESRALLQTTYPFLGTEYKSKFTKEDYAGIHQHGAGVTGDGAFIGRSPYQYDAIVGEKLKEISSVYGVAVGATKQDSINAIEDILCDEYQLEFAFEGTRWYDLMRLAKHKNAAGLYDPNFGSIWLARKLEYKNPVKSLLDPQNWYLPFK